MAYGDNFGEHPYVVGVDYKADFFEDIRRRLVIPRFANTTDLEQRKGDIVDVTKLLDPSLVTRPAEGIEEDEGEEIQTEHLQFVLRRYNRWFPTYRHVVKTAEDDVLKMTRKAARKQIRYSMENLGANIIRGGNSVFHADGTVTGSVATTVRSGMIKVAERYLMNNEVEEITEMQSSSANYEMMPLDSCFIGMCDGDIAADIANLSDAIKVENYASGAEKLPGEFAKVGKVRFLSTSFLPPTLGGGASVDANDYKATGGKADVYPIIIFGQDAFEFGGLQGESDLEINVHNAKVDSADKHGNKGFISWQSWFGGMIREQKAITRLECVAKTDAKLGA